VTINTGTTADHYLILGIRPDAELEEVRAAYRAKMRLWHPDLIPGVDEDVQRVATDMTARLNEAYECLSDPHRRAAYDARRGDGSNSPAHPNTPAPRRSRETPRPGRPVRHVITVSLGGVVAPLLGLIWAAGLLPGPAPASPSLIAALCVGVMAATIWLLASSRMLRRTDRLSPIGVAWSHLMRWSGWALIGGCAVFLGIPVIVFALTVVFAAPFLGLILIAFISGRSDPDGR
jgi:hypothetical protein